VAEDRVHRSHAIVLTQRADGSWYQPSADTSITLDTCLALLFLKEDFLLPEVE
jgi:hypothetical protein